jgi:hypothetical protein
MLINNFRTKPTCQKKVLRQQMVEAWKIDELNNPVNEVQPLAATSGSDRLVRLPELFQI